MSALLAVVILCLVALLAAALTGHRRLASALCGVTAFLALMTAALEGHRWWMSAWWLLITFSAAVLCERWSGSIPAENKEEG